jgi:serine protease Do
MSNDSVSNLMQNRDGLAKEIEALGALIGRSTVQVLTGESGGGSGIIWRSEGLILTNAHVARGHRAVIRLWDGQRLDARVVRRDPRRDLAALAVEARELPAAVAGDSRQLKAGQLVIAIGSPWGVPGALALGIAHANGASPDDTDPRVVCADVRLAPGNSGGPLADINGRVVGVNTMIAGGLAIAISTSEVSAFLRDLAASREASRAA